MWPVYVTLLLGHQYCDCGDYDEYYRGRGERERKGGREKEEGRERERDVTHVQITTNSMHCNTL